MRKSPYQISKELNEQLEKQLKVVKDLAGASTLQNVLSPKDVQDILEIAAKPLLAKVISNLWGVLESDSKNLVNSFKVFRGKKGSKKYTVYVGPDYRFWHVSGRTKAKETMPGIIGGGQAAHLLEYGTVERTRRSISEDGKVTMVSTGAVKARPFMRPAWEQTKDEVTNIAVGMLIKHVDKEMKNRGMV